MDKSTKTILLVAAAGVAVYLLTRKRTTTTGYPAGYVAPAYNPQLAQQNQTAQTIQAGTSAINTLNNIVQSWFNKPSTATTATVQQPTYTPPPINTTLTQPVRI